MPLLFLLCCTSIMYTRVMALMSFLKLKFFSLMISFISFVQAEETSVNFSMNCNSLEGQSQPSSRLSGGKLNYFWQNKIEKLLQFSCRSGIDHPLELCALNNRWPLDDESWLIQTYCDHSGYLISSVWFVVSNDGVAPIHLEYPTFDWNFEDLEKQIVESITATGVKKTAVLTDAEFDPNKKLINSHNYCCAGKLSTTIQWLAEDGAFVLRYLKVDGIRNGNASTQLAFQYD